MILRGLHQMVPVEENSFGANALHLDWLDEEISLAGVDLVDDTLEGDDRGVDPAWVIATPA